MPDEADRLDVEAVWRIEADDDDVVIMLFEVCLCLRPGSGPMGFGADGTACAIELFAALRILFDDEYPLLRFHHSPQKTRAGLKKAGPAEHPLIRDSTPGSVYVRQPGCPSPIDNGGGPAALRLRITRICLYRINMICE